MKAASDEKAVHDILAVEDYLERLGVEQVPISLLWQKLYSECLWIKRQ